MADVTTQIYDDYIQTIRCANNKRHYKVRKLEQRINEHISGLRQLAIQKRGTFVSRFCHAEATRLERNLYFAKFGIRL